MRRAILLMALLPGMAQGVSAQTASLDIPYEKFTLSNGLTVIVHEDHKAPIVAVDVWYHVGSKNEKPGKTGFAHLFEHLMFGGSEHAPGRYIDALERIGATNLNGTTNEDRTNYFQNVPSPALDYTLWMESDRMGHLLGALDQKRLDLQRGVVQNEKRQGENQPYGVVEQLLAQNTYPPGHPYSWTVIGEMADLDAASMADVQQWFKTYYGPSNAVLVLAGDIDAKTAREKVEKYFGAIPPGPPLARQQAWIAKMSGTHRQTVQDRVPQARIYKVWNVPPYGSADADYLGMAANILSQGRTSRFYKRLVYDEQLATDVTASVDSREIGGQFIIRATVRNGQTPEQAEKALDEELARFLKEGPTAGELERVKAQSVSNFIRGMERIGGFGGKADRLAQSQTFLGSPDAYKQSLQRVQEATAETVRSAASRWLSDGVYILTVTPFPDYKALSTDASRSKAPEIGAAPDLKLPKMQRAALSNGLKVILTERHQVPLVNFWLVADAGYSADPPGAAGTANMTAALLDSGTKTRSSEQISEELALLGARLQSNAALDSSAVELSALKAKLDPALQIFADVIQNPAFPEAEFQRRRQQQLAAIQREQNNPNQMALRVLPALLYGPNHPYGNSFTGSGTAASVSKMTREDLVKFEQTWYAPNNCTLIVAGDTTLAEILPKLETAFAGWRPRQTPKKNIGPAAWPGQSAVYLIDRPGSLQSLIVAAAIAPPKADPGTIAIEAMNDALGGLFSSRLNLNLREDKHWAYGANSRLPGARAQRPFMAIAPVQTDKTKESLAEMEKEFRGIAGERPVTAEELAAVQADQTLRLPGSRETLDQLGRATRDLVEFGLPDDYYEAYAAKVRALTTSDLNQAAKAIIRPGQMIWLIIGDRAKIEAGIRELNWGEIRFLDPAGNPIGAGGSN